MLTRFRVSGFKNLIDVDVRFGPFTCIAGANGIGKSNLFDAILFLSALADRPLIEAARSVRDENGRTGDIRSLFHRSGPIRAEEMSFEAEMIVPREGIDDLGQRAAASLTLLRYSLTLAARQAESNGTAGLEIVREELVPIKLGDAHKTLLFPHQLAWRKSILCGHRARPYISTEGSGPERTILLHQDGTGGRPGPRTAMHLPRTVLSAVYAAESPTALLARRELQSWRRLQLEPSALRKPDEFTAPTRIGPDGSHLAATLYHLARQQQAPGAADLRGSHVYGQVANRLAQLIQDVSQVWIDRDEKRELLTLQVSDRGGTAHPARALSDGTLRFLALTVLELDPGTQGLLCLEEPENGIHPERIPAMLRLLMDIATDTEQPVGPDNPLRQVIVNTHSPAVVQEVPEASLLVAELKDTVRDDRHFSRVSFSCLPGTWRTSTPECPGPVSLGKLLSYLNPVLPAEADVGGVAAVQPNSSRKKALSPSRRVRDRLDLQMLLFPQHSEVE